MAMRNNKITNVYSVSCDDETMIRILRFCAVKNWSKTRFAREAAVAFLDREEPGVGIAAAPPSKQVTSKVKKKRRR